jgi:hypothetical protein
MPDKTQQGLVPFTALNVAKTKDSHPANYVTKKRSFIPGS